MSEITVLPDGSAFGVMSLSLPDDHWLFADPESGNEEPPMPMRIGTDDPRRTEMRKMLYQAGRYAVRTATSNGEIDDFDPDALIQNLVVGMLGYNTSDGLSHLVVDENEIINPIPWSDPSPEDLRLPEFEAIWQTIKTWDINVPEAYVGYCGASGNHVKAILDALRQIVEQG